MKKIAVILAGGEGHRAGGGVPKQFRMLSGRPVLWWSMNAFHKEDSTTRIILIIHPDYMQQWQECVNSMPECDRIQFEMYPGGSTRHGSVANALDNVQIESDSYIAVHDAARPFLDIDMIGRGWAVAQSEGVAVPVVPLSDSIRHVSEDGSEAVERKNYMAVQTPQIFSTEILKKSYMQPYNPSFTDDASVVEAAGYSVALYDGDVSNFKITNPIDFKIAETVFASKQSE